MDGARTHREVAQSLGISNGALDGGDGQGGQYRRLLCNRIRAREIRRGDVEPLPAQQPAHTRVDRREDNADFVVGR
jgi:hypothetical protein